MKNILLNISFNGSFFHGWQIQPNAVTVQQTLCDAIKNLTNESVNLIGCSRTDSGVHANSFVCNFKTESTIPPEKFADALNCELPDTVVVKESFEVPESFHARYDCKGKRYVYRILNTKTKSPFFNGLVFHYPYEIDVEKLDRASKDFVGTHDFTAFCAAGSDVADKVRTIRSFQVFRRGDEVVFSVEGDGFLYNMVRIMVGTLLDIGRGKIDQNSIKKIISEKSRDNAGVTVPGEGLYLDEVFYDGVF
ncbi:MAG: tRNA pseudouridine(38-40) synthase TruA [Clostridia bacterium]|nr:tRNA pseudouridine(38-40) synthase TruA [Clostridia bacterium]